MTIQMKAVILSSNSLCYCLLCCTCKVVLTFESVDEILKCGHLMKIAKQYLPVMQHKVVLTFESVDEILKCHHLNESY